MKRILASSLCISLFLSCDQQPLSINTTDSEVDPAVSMAAVSASFVKNYGGTGSEMSKSVIRTSDGGYALLGSSNGDFYLVKTDANGNSQWQKTYGSSSVTENGNDLRQTSDGGFILIGTAGNYAKIIKTSSNGALQWQTSTGYINAASGMSIALSNDNGFVGTGWGSYNNVTKAAVFKLNSSGSLLWLKSYGSVSTSGNSIERTSDNGFIVAGKAIVSSNNSDVYLLKINSQGDLQWQKTWGGTYSDGGNHAIQTSDAGYAVVGYDGKDASKSNVYLIKTDPQGKYQWIKGYFPSEGASGYALQQLSDGSYAIAARIYSQASLLKVSSNGTYKWRTDFSSSVLKNASDLVIASDGGFVLTGQVNSGSLNEQAALVKTDKNGSLSVAAVVSTY